MFGDRKYNKNANYTLLTEEDEDSPTPPMMYPYPSVIYPAPSVPTSDTPESTNRFFSDTSHLSLTLLDTNGHKAKAKGHKSKSNEKTYLTYKPPTPLYFRFIYLVSLADVIVFIISIYKNNGFEPFGVNPMIGPSANVLLELGANYDQKILDDGQWWRFITPIFLHAGVIHLLFNLMFQILQGVPLEIDIGSLRLAVIYMLSGVAGNLMSSIFLPAMLSVGASGSLFGLLGAMLAALVINWEFLKRPGKSIFFLLLAIGVNLFIGLLPYIDNFAHVGGLLGGILFGFALIPSARSSSKNSFLTAFGLAAGIVGLVGGFFTFYTRFDVHNWCTWCMYIDCLPVMGWCDSYKDD